jgi:protein-tyrosine-phosphatase
VGTASKSKVPGHDPGNVRAEAIVVMNELGIDISGHRSKHVNEFQGQSFDYVLTVSENAKESCPLLPGTHNAFTKRLKTRQRFRVRKRNG